MTRIDSLAPDRRRSMPAALIVATGVVGVALAVVHVVLFVDRGASPVVLIALCGFSMISVALAVIDARTHRLPNRIVLPSLAVLAVLVGVEALIAGDPAPALRALLAAGGSFAVFFLIATLAPASLGGGDVKLVALTGGITAWIGWPAFICALAAAFVLAGIVTVVLLAGGAVRRGGAVAFGPFLCAGAWIGLLFGSRLLPVLVG